MYQRNREKFKSGCSHSDNDFLHLGPAYYNQDGLNGSKDISMSSLRRKLFSQVGNVNEADKGKLEPPTEIK